MCFTALYPRRPPACPGGTFDNSPAFQRREEYVSIRPEGTVEILKRGSAVPSGLIQTPKRPALKRRAILTRSLRDQVRRPGSPWAASISALCFKGHWGKRTTRHWFRTFAKTERADAPSPPGRLLSRIRRQGVCARSIRATGCSDDRKNVDARRENRSDQTSKHRREEPARIDRYTVRSRSVRRCFGLPPKWIEPSLRSPRVR